MNTPIHLDATALLWQRRAFVAMLIRQMTTQTLIAARTSMYAPYIDRRKHGH